jgi:V/A-type H+-transporting ATPase subunit C
VSAYLNTRVTLFSSRLWQSENLNNLIDTPAEEMGATLGAHDLPQLAAGFDSLDNRSLEQRIIAQLLEETTVLIRPLAGIERDFLIYWTERFEVSNLKTLLRGKMTRERPAALLNRLTPMGSFGRLDIQDLAHAEDVNELLRRLEAGPYATIVRQARRGAFKESHNPFILDAALDRSYYEGLAQRARPLETAAGLSFRRLMGTLIDRINLVWLLRYRFNYNLPPSQVYFLLVGSHYSLGSMRLRELAALTSLADILTALPAPLRASMEGVTEIPQVFTRMEHAAAASAQQVLHSDAPAIARAFAYLLLRERDLRAVRAVLRGRLLSLPTADIRLAMYQTLEGNA